MPYKKYKPKKKYTILQLLKRQLKTFKKQEEFPTIVALYNSSTSLKKLKFSRKCYTYLHKADISPEHLSDFYARFDLPKHPFFPMFFKLKKEFAGHKKTSRSKKDEYILKKMNCIGNDVKTFIRYLAKYEKNLNKRKRCPEWIKTVYPKTKKQADRISRYSKLQWTELFNNYLSGLRKRYVKNDGQYGEKIVSLFILELPIKKHSADEIKKQYRLLSKKHHPDVGGDAAYFNILQHARDVLSD
jgi:hypothetical protein